MAPFTPLCFLDTWALSSSLRAKLNLFDAAAAHAVFRIREREGGYAGELREWRPLASLIQRVRKWPLFADQEFGAMMMHRLGPGGTTPWIAPDGWLRAYLPIVANPACLTFCGVAAQALPIGMLVALDPAQYWSCVNWGETPGFCLTVESRKAAEPTEIHDPDL